MQKPLVSVVIPTYQRPELLRDALTSLINQTAKRGFEIIVVDNDPNRSAQAVVRSFNLFPITYHLEPKIGHSHAKNAGLKIARGRYVLFLDDDAKVGSDYIAFAFSKIINLKSPSVFGGPIKPYYPQGKPAWFKNSYEARSFGNSIRPLQINEFLPTASTFIAAKELRKISGFNPSYGIKGGKRRFGEDTDVLRRLRLHNPKLSVIYHPKLVVWHATPRFKTTLAYRFRHLYQLGASGLAVSGAVPSLPKIILKAGLAIFGLIFGFIFAGLFRNKTAYPYWQQYAYEKISPQLYWLGMLSGYFKSL